MGPAVAGPPPPPFGHNWPGFRLHVTRFAVLRGLYFFSHSCGPWLSWILWSAVGAGLKCISPRLTSRMV